ncbi:MAG: putative sulfate exporter family transporter [Ornithinimicrobium sp.]
MLISCVLAAFAIGLALATPLVAAPIWALLLGVGLRQWWTPGEHATIGLKWCSTYVLQASVVLFGARLTFGEIADVGVDTLPVLAGTLIIALALGPFLGRLLGVQDQVATLVTVGTTICGASAIATIGAVIGAGTSAMAVSMAVIFAYNAAAAVLFPLVGHAMGLSEPTFAIWAGTAINDTSSVVAAGTAYGAVAASGAVVVKLTRTLAIIPLAMWHGYSAQRATRDVPGTGDGAGEGSGDAEMGSGTMSLARLVPPFLMFFLLAAGLRSAGGIPDAALEPIRMAALAGTCVAMAAIGAQTPLSAIRGAGWGPMILGGLLWVAVASSALALIALT